MVYLSVSNEYSSSTSLALSLSPRHLFWCFFQDFIFLNEVVLGIFHWVGVFHGFFTMLGHLVPITSRRSTKLNRIFSRVTIITSIIHLKLSTTTIIPYLRTIITTIQEISKKTLIVRCLYKTGI